MSTPFYPQNPAVVNLQNFDQRQPTYAQLYRPEGHTSFSSVPLNETVTQQPTQHQSIASQLSGGPSHFERDPQFMQNGIPLPGFEILDRVPTFKIHPQGIRQGHSTCCPGYKINNTHGQLMLTGTSDTLFCPFDSKLKNVNINDEHGDCIFQVKFTPSICACDSQEKRCFAVFSPAFVNPFGAIIFEAGVIKHSLKILNALEGETFAVEFMGSHYISIKGAEGSIVAVITVDSKRGEGLTYTLSYMEEVSLANKALFIGCAITLDLVGCERTVTRCMCLVPVMCSLIAIIGLSIGSGKRKRPITG